MASEMNYFNWIKNLNMCHLQFRKMKGYNQIKAAQ